MENYKTPFGDIQVDPETIITFPSGLLGFPECKRYKLLHEDKPNPQVMWLQSLDDMAVCFNVVEAERLGLTYQVTLTDEECTEIELQSSDEAKLLLVLDRNEQGTSGIVANTQAPFVLNVRARKALQKTGVRADIVLRNV